MLLDLLEELWTQLSMAGATDDQQLVLTRAQTMLPGLGRIDPAAQVVHDPSRPVVMAADDALALMILKRAGETRAERPPFDGWSYVTVASVRFRLSFICRVSNQPVTICGPVLSRAVGGSGVTCEVTCPACRKTHALLVAEAGQKKRRGRAAAPGSLGGKHDLDPNTRRHPADPVRPCLP